TRRAVAEWRTARGPSARRSRSGPRRTAGSPAGGDRPPGAVRCHGARSRLGDATRRGGAGDGADRAEGDEAPAPAKGDWDIGRQAGDRHTPQPQPQPQARPLSRPGSAERAGDLRARRLSLLEWVVDADDVSPGVGEHESPTAGIP